MQCGALCLSVYLFMILFYDLFMMGGEPDSVWETAEKGSTISSCEGISAVPPHGFNTSQCFAFEKPILTLIQLCACHMHFCLNASEAGAVKKSMVLNASVGYVLWKMTCCCCCDQPPLKPVYRVRASVLGQRIRWT